MLRRSLFAIIAGFSVLAGHAVAQQVGQQVGQPGELAGSVVSTKDESDHGTYLVDGEGRALYLFTPDTQGTGGAAAVSACDGACAEVWPPAISMDEPTAEGQADAALLGRIERADGAMQVTYNGWPLYYYAQDLGPDEATGQNQEGYGGAWHLVTQDGEKIGD